MKMKDFTVEKVERALTDFRWCAYHGVFHNKDDFSNAQKLAPWKARYCVSFANEQKRAKTTMVNEMPVPVIAAMARRMRVTLADLPEEQAVVPTARDERSGKRHREAAESSNDGRLRGKRARKNPPPQQPPPKKRKGKDPVTTPVEDDDSEDSVDDQQGEIVDDIHQWILDRLPNTTAHDEAAVYGMLRRDHNGTLWSRARWETHAKATDLDFRTALDDVRARRHACLAHSCWSAYLTGACLYAQGVANDERREAAAADIEHLDECVVPMIDVLTNSRERTRRKRAVNRVRNRLNSAHAPLRAFARLQLMRARATPRRYRQRRCGLRGRRARLLSGPRRRRVPHQGHGEDVRAGLLLRLRPVGSAQARPRQVQGGVEDEGERRLGASKGRGDGDRHGNLLLSREGRPSYTPCHLCTLY
jgi:hypothetical protein